MLHQIEHVGQLQTLLIVETFEDLLAHFVAELAHLLHSLVPPAGEIDPLDPAVVGIRPTLDESRGLKSINQTTKGGLAQFEDSRQVALDHAIVT
ncbi:hypothetical protein D9M68_1005500 [compost metagenome]